MTQFNGDDRMRELARRAGLIAPYGSDTVGLRDFDYRAFCKLIVADCSEIVRGVLREEGSTLSYKDAATLQERFREAFDIAPDWSEP